MVSKLTCQARRPEFTLQAQLRAFDLPLPNLAFNRTPTCCAGRGRLTM
jgi:hypothetical protein